jgi:hypothetical protein
MPTESLSIQHSERLGTGDRIEEVGLVSAQPSPCRVEGRRRMTRRAPSARPASWTATISLVIIVGCLIIPSLAVIRGMADGFLAAIGL